MSIDDLPAALTSRFAEDPGLARYTAARLGGPADALIVARDTDDLEAIVTAAWGAGVPVRVLGGGANVLISDAGVDGLIVINNRTAEIVPLDATTLRVSAGTALTHLTRTCATLGLRGFEWAVAVPGTVGGAVVNNAGAHGTSMADCVVSAWVVEPSGAREWTTADLDYAYRHSALKSRADRRFLVTGATLRLTPDNPADINARMAEYNAHRKRTQPSGASLGSVFKNPPGDYAGRLIEACGLKGHTIGGAQVSPVHANFFINAGGKATAADYYTLIRHVQAVVEAQFGVRLEPEIELLGRFADA
ncbi:MAG: UDP-N-acetylmuramate dehydrogenase [Anaerolineae bacterium]|nr:MAG: UDP-N-acetylenolpyruvoylglucosamine reductase [Chloroflexi bacterium OLB13]MBW7880216.1 UDP-N-acetylmuramate dehydrogenase [Anaerolineae bacterium]